MIQFTAPISHGSSGGALFNADGKVIGVTFATIEEGQNLNYAVDIDDVALLYANRSGSKMGFAEYYASAAPTNTPRPAATPTPVAKPTPKPTSKISGLTAKQIGPDSVELTWNENNQGSFTYNVKCSMPENPFVNWSEDTTTNTKYVFKNLVPGCEYTFSVNAKQLYIAIHSVILKVREADKFTSRNFKAKSFSIYYCKAGADFWNTKRTKITKFTSESLEQVGITRDYNLVLDFSISKADQDSNWDIMVCLAAPGGDVYRIDEGLIVEKEGHTNYSIAAFLNTLLGMYPYINENGTYTIKMYINSQLAAETSFKVN